MKKSLILFISIIFIFILNMFNVTAATNGETYWDDQKAYNFTSNVVEEKEIAYGTTFIHDAGYTVRSDTKYDQNVYIMLQKSDAAKGVKVVTWGGYNENHTVSTALPRMTLAKIAEDYELNHPGWKVIGGINADQYCWGYGSQATSGYDLLENRPYYTMKADGENWFSHHFMGGNCTNLVGFLNDGNQQLVFNPAVAGSDPHFKLNIYDENNNLLGKFDVNDLNPKSKLSGEYTYVYALTDTGNNDANLKRDKESKSKNISSENDLYIVSAADKTWVSNSVDYSYFKGTSARNSFFGKGKVDQVSKSTTINATQFAIESTNPEVLKYLKQGCYVVAQYEIYGGYENCESAIGWHTVQRFNGSDQNVSNSYNNRGYPRSVFGVTSDGRVALITGNGTTKSGLYAQEINAVCKAYDIQTAFQMDGGGSVTMIMRNINGGFDTINEPSDGNDRSIYNGLFFVVKDVEAEIEAKSISQESLELDVNVLDYGKEGNVTNTYVNLYGKTKTGKDFYKQAEVKNGTAKFDGLESNIEYTYKVAFKLEGDDELIESFTGGLVKTAKKVPTIKEVRMNMKDNNLEINVSMDDPDKSIRGFLKVSIDGGKTFTNVQAGSMLKYEDFKGDPLSNIIIEYKYDVNDGKGTVEESPKEFYINYSLTIFMEALLNSNNQFIDSCFKVEEE